MANLHRLSNALIKSAKPGDRLTDGGGLRLDFDAGGRGAWIFRFTSPATGKERFMGLGPLADVPITTARRLAQEARTSIREGRDPIAERRERKATAQIAAKRSVTFRQCADRYIDAHEATWKNAKHRQQWRNSLATYVFPVIGVLPVADVDAAAVLQILEPIWQAKPETASRVRGRIETI